MSNNQNVNPISKIIENSKYKIYDIYLNGDINNFKIEIKHNNINIYDDILNNLSYDINNDKIIIENLLSSLIFKYDKNFHDYINIKYDNSILYIFLLPILTSKNEYIIKIGYTDNLYNRKNELMIEFNIDNIYLIYCCDIKNEYREKKIHKIIKKYTKYYYPVIKNNKYSKKEKIITKNKSDNKIILLNNIIIDELSNLHNDENNEKLKEINNKKSYSNETYIFSYNIIKFVLNILYQMKKLDDIYLIQLDIEKKKLDNDRIYAINEKINLINNSKKLDNNKIYAENKRINLINNSKKLDNDNIYAINERIIIIFMIFIMFMYLINKYYR